MNNKLKETEKEVNTTELEQVKDLLQKYDIVLKDNVDEMDLILKYETFYGQINEFVTNKRNDIVGVEKMIKNIYGIVDRPQFETILKKKKDNTN